MGRVFFLYNNNGDGRISEREFLVSVWYAFEKNLLSKKIARKNKTSKPLACCPAPPAVWSEQKQQKTPGKDGAFVFEVLGAI